MNIPSIIVIGRKRYPRRLECAASRIGEVIRANGVCTMKMVQSLVMMVSTLSSEVQQLRIDSDTLKTQLRDLQQAPSHVPSIQREAVSSAIANTATAKSYRDVVCAVRGNPGVTAIKLRLEIFYLCRPL
jgi:hypothetical protein